MNAFAKLHVLLASTARVGLVIRHGTAKSVCTLLWDRKYDTFTLGQWMRGRIRTDVCDLSPDGAHFLYSADKTTVDGRIGWTVVSRTPYLKAIAYYPHRWGGGWFVSNRDYCVPFENPDPADLEHPEVWRVEAELPTPSLYAARLVRAGWTIEDLRSNFAGKQEFVREVAPGWTLRHVVTGGYRLSCGDFAADTRGWDWADIDGKRLVWSVKGCLWEGRVGKAGVEQVKLLHDFNGMKFEAVAAPYEGGRAVLSKRPLLAVDGPAFRKVAKRGQIRKKPNRSKIWPEDEA